MALGGYPQLLRQLLEERRDNPHVVGLDEIGSKDVDQRRRGVGARRRGTS